MMPVFLQLTTCVRNISEKNRNVEFPNKDILNVPTKRSHRPLKRAVTHDDSKLAMLHLLNDLVFTFENGKYSVGFNHLHSLTFQRHRLRDND